jgi:hypothetical protein
VTRLGGWVDAEPDGAGAAMTSQPGLKAQLTET